MKKMKNIALISAGICTSLLFAACGGGASEKPKNNGEDMEHGGEHTYACPMHPDITGKEGDKCLKCGMKLEHNDNAVKSNGLSYFMDFKSVPGELDAGAGGILTFIPKIKGKETTAVPLDEVHEKKIHLIVVSNDLSYFEHIHPEFQADGSYQIKILPKGTAFTIDKGHNETRFEQGGDYMLFADYAPTGGTHQLEKIPISVKGKEYTSTTFSKEKLTSSIDGFTVALEADGGQWATNKQMHIKATVKKGNKLLDANSFENYLGAKSHMVVLKTGSFDYLHVHPEVENGSLDLHTTFESDGIYRGWLQFQTEGKVHTADFVIIVKAGKASMQMENHQTHNH